MCFFCGFCTTTSGPLSVIAAKVGRSEGCVFQKCKRLGLRVIIFCLRFKIITHAINLPKEEKLGLEVVKHFLGDFCLTSSLELPKVLPSVEEALKIYAGASQKGRWELLLVSEKIKKTTTVPLAG